VHVAFAHLQRGARWADSAEAQGAMKAKVVSNLQACARIIEDRHMKSPWALGDQFSLCDPYLFLVPRWMAKAGADLSEFPKLAAHHDAMLKRPAVLTVMAVHGL
jgi:glutathione S-transferase